MTVMTVMAVMTVKERGCLVFCGSGFSLTLRRVRLKPDPQKSDVLKNGAGYLAIITVITVITVITAITVISSSCDRSGAGPASAGRGSLASWVCGPGRG